MEKIRFAQLPLSVKIVIALTLGNTLVLFEEIVIDRGGWYRYLPLYRYQRFCAWDIGAIVLILLAVFGERYFFRRRS